MVRYSKSISYYRQYYKLIAVAVVIMMAVLSGSLLLGDSVRHTLVERVNERLGDTETIITSGTGFLDESIADAPLLQDARAYLVCEGFVSSEGKMTGVQVWCCDKDSISMGEAIINEPLSRQINEEDIVLHLPSHSLVPSGSLFVTKRYSTQLRLHVQGVRKVEDGGNLLLHNEQKLPLNIFMNRQELASAMGLEGKLNLIMSPEHITEKAFQNIWTPEMSGYCFSPIEKSGEIAVTSDRIFLSQSLVDALQPQRLCFAYLVNDIRTEELSVPYSFVTATNRWKGKPLTDDELILSDYAAKRLGSHIGDSIELEYYVSPGMKALETRTHRFFVKDIVALDEFKGDSLLMTEYPGLSKVEHCNDWDSDLPVNMDRISKEDEDYWYKHRHTPKAIVAYDAVRQDWCSSFGVATAVSVEDTVLLSSAPASFHPLTFSPFNLSLIHPRESAIYAANNGTDFSSLFLALGFFIILSGILLMQSPLAEMLTERRQETSLYKSLGYGNRRIYHLILREIGCVLLLALPAGILLGILYSNTTLFLLGNVWSGATHTEGFHLHISFLTILISLISGLLICLIAIILTIRKFIRQFHHSSAQEEIREIKADNMQKQNRFAWFMLALTMALFVYNWIFSRSIVFFVVCSILWLVASGLFFISFIQKKAYENIPFCRDAMIWKTLSSQRSQVRLSFWALAVGVFTVFAVGLNRPDFSHASDDSEMTGGFNLWCESQVPMEYDLNNKAVRRKLSLQDINDSTLFLQFNKYTQDEASCLNLNKVSTPSVLGADINALQKYFGIDTSPLHDISTDGAIPILIDSESLTWSLMKSVGDTLIYNGSDGSPLKLIIAGSYPTGIFHGTALMNREHFRQTWKDETGSRIILARTDTYEDTKDLMETALSEYGVSISTTTDRINLFFTVTDTYLAIFLTLGGLGLIVGIFCLIIVVRKNITARRMELQTLSSLGFSHQRIIDNMTRENTIVPFVAIITGSIGSLISISANATGAGFPTILTAIIFLFLLFALTYFGIRRIITTTVPDDLSSGKEEIKPSLNNSI